MKFVIKGQPPSVNHCYITRAAKNRVYRFLSEKGKAYKKSFLHQFQKQVKQAPYTCDVALIITFYFGDNRRRDIDNYNKVLFDAMQQFVFLDDSQIVSLHVTKEVDVTNPRVEVEVIPMEKGD